MLAAKPSLEQALQVRDQQIEELLLNSSPLRYQWLGTLSYESAREIQNQALQRVLQDPAEEVIYLCEHHPCLTLGRRTPADEIGLTQEQWAAKGVEVIEVDRGGAATYHGYGQLMVYPVLSLRRRKLGVRDFVAQGLELLAATARDLGVPSHASLCPAGVWREVSGASEPQRKLLSVGLRIERGVSNHGYCLNINCDLENFSFFTPCGQQAVQMTSLGHELQRDSLSFPEVIKSLLKNSGDFWCLAG